MQIARRLLREFWLPALVAVAWTVFNIYSTKSWDFKAIVNVFGPSFFLASWATGQFFRVQKQVGVEKNLTSIETRVTTLVERLEKHTTDFLGYATGGDSWASFRPMLPSRDTLELMLHNESKYPVFDVYAEAIDLDEPIEPDKGRLWTRHRFVLHSLFPNKGVMGAYRFDLKDKDRLKVNVFTRTRNNGSMPFRVERDSLIGRRPGRTGEPAGSSGVTAAGTRWR
ncbi:hypothetical protein, partial [Methylibium sp.]|uniref:hypothetical protein n=1 Tax=Methylibium sp. TaxID=2067992 RepID=UPI0017FBBA30